MQVSAMLRLALALFAAMLAVLLPVLRCFSMLALTASFAILMPCCGMLVMMMMIQQRSNDQQLITSMNYF